MLSVVLFHFDFPFLEGGFVGVDVFFVISGYLITKKLLGEIRETGQIDFGAFYEGRIRRLFPALLATLVATAAAGYFLMPPSGMNELGQSVLASVLGVANIFFWLQTGYFDTASLDKPLLHMWSLGVEEQFYILWPVVLLLLATRSMNGQRIAFAGIFVASLLACAFVMRGFPGMPFLTDPLAEGPSISFYLTPFRGFEFIAGAALCLLPAVRHRWAGEASTALGLALIAWAVLSFDHTTPFPAFNALIPAIGSALVIYGGQNSRVGMMLRVRPMVWIGLISYSLYLVHWPLVTFYRLENGALDRWDKIALLAISFAAATLMHRFIERPFRTRGSRFHLRRQHLFGGLGVGVALSLAFTVTSVGGMVWRVPGMENAMSSVSAYGGEDCPFPGCEAGTGAVPILVAGDSFARQLYTGLTAEFPEQRFVFRDQRTCATWSLRWSRWDGDTDPRTCLPERQIVLDHLAQGLPVILANHWGISSFFDANQLALTGRLDRMDIQDDEAFSFAASEVAQIMAETEAPILVIANPPDTTSIGDLQKCMFKSLSGACSTLPIEAVNRRRGFAQAASAMGLEVIDPFDALCNQTSCATYDGQGLFYSDEYHLSRLGSERFIAGLRPEFEAFFQSIQAAPNTAGLLHEDGDDALIHQAAD